MKLIITFVILNVVLFLSYFFQGVNKSDFGNVPEHYHLYMLLAASIAYAFNIIHVISLHSRGAEDKYTLAAVMSYYILQLFFIPAVRSKNKELVQFLLGVCCLPIAYLFVTAKGHEKVLSLITLLHVVFNDFLLYGFLH